MNIKHFTAQPFSYFKFEITLIIVFALSKFILMDWLDMRAFYISGVCFFWLAYIYYRYRRDKSVMTAWGFSGSDLKKSIIKLLPFAMFSIISSVIYGTYTGTFINSWHILPILGLYPIWGTFQQFIVVGLIVQNLSRFKTATISKPFLVLIGALLFSLVHSPDIFLMTFTFFMEIIFIMVFLKYKNMWALGLTHGLVATFLLYFVEGRDLWAELFAWF